ncbi:hypothetical protein Zm00014a_011813 [Zea mays]|uniref:Uncharacterized protein n=1 Tax=Zea mays TaxID=4577 RepID=A0A3L6EXF6_MAIZE|nr:hypothetical protein Zm00014a_011813 [Zea mays]
MAMGLPGLRCHRLLARGSLPPLGPALYRRPLERTSALCYSSLQAQAGDGIGEEALRMFLEDRQLHGDFITKIFDMVWRRNGANVGAAEATTGQGSAIDVAQPEDVREDVVDEGMLRLAAISDWVSGDSSPPLSKRLSTEERQNESNKRKELNLLKYEATAVSYALGVGFSCLYLQLLYQLADNLSKEDIPEVFLKKKVKKIGITSEDLKNTIEKTLGGAGLALSSPRLMIPAVIYGLSALSHHFQNSFFSFEVLPGMMGFLAYKAAALVQVYRDNEDLRLILPDEEAADSDST